MSQDKPIIAERKHTFTMGELFLLILPLMAESALNMLIGMADTMMVAQCGEDAVSAVSLVDSVSNLLITIFNSFATGGAVVCSQYIGSGDTAKAKDTAKNLVYISLAIGLLIMALLLPLRMFVIEKIFGTINDAVKSYSNDYFFYLTLSYPFLSLYSAFTALSRSEKKTPRTFYVALLMNAINIGGNALLIFYFNMGPKGAAIATLASRVVGSFVLFILLSRKKETLSINRILRGPVNFSLMKRIGRIGIPSGVEGSLFHIGKISVMSMVSALGSSAVAINAVISNFNSYANIPGNAINLAIITVIGQCRGNNNFDDIRYYSKLLLSFVYLFTLLVTLPLFIFTPEVVGLYGLEEASIAEAIPIGRRCLFFCFLIWPTSFSIPQILKAVGDVKFIMITSLLSMYLVRVLGAYFFIKVFNMGVEGVWIAMYLDWAIRSVIFITRLLRGKWKKIKVIE